MLFFCIKGRPSKIHWPTFVLYLDCFELPLIVPFFFSSLANERGTTDPWLDKTDHLERLSYTNGEVHTFPHLLPQMSIDQPMKRDILPTNIILPFFCLPVGLFGRVQLVVCWVSLYIVPIWRSLSLSLSPFQFVYVHMLVDELQLWQGSFCTLPAFAYVFLSVSFVVTNVYNVMTLYKCCQLCNSKKGIASLHLQSLSITLSMCWTHRTRTHIHT